MFTGSVIAEDKGVGQVEMVGVVLQSWGGFGGKVMVVLGWVDWYFDQG